MKYFRRKTQLLQQNFFFGFIGIGFGLAADKPVPNAFVP